MHRPDVGLERGTKSCPQRSLLCRDLHAIQVHGKQSWSEQRERRAQSHRRAGRYAHEAHVHRIASPTVNPLVDERRGALGVSRIDGRALPAERRDARAGHGQAASGEETAE